MICGSIGPRIGEEGTPRCAKGFDHQDLHQGYHGSGFEGEFWGRCDLDRFDLEFAADYERHVKASLEDVSDV
jgi:hypothetical protein